MSPLPIPIKPSVLHEHPHNPQSHLNRTFYSTGTNSIKYIIIIITSSPSDSRGKEESGHSSVSAGWDSRAGMGQKNYVVHKVHSASVPDLFSSVGATSSHCETTDARVRIKKRPTLEDMHSSFELRWLLLTIQRSPFLYSVQPFLLFLWTLLILKQFKI